MSSKEILQLKPETRLVDRYSGNVFTVADLSEIIAQMLSTRQADVEEFCRRFDLAE